MKNNYQKNRLYHFKSIALLFCTFLFYNSSFAQSISGTIVGVEYCTTYSYGVTMPAGSFNVRYNWSVTGSETTLSTTAKTASSVNILWKNAPDTSVPKNITCHVTYDRNVQSGNTVITTRDNTGTAQATIGMKYIAPLGSIAINGVAQSSFDLVCGTGPLTISVPLPQTAPSSTIAYTWALPANWIVSGTANSNTITAIPSVNTGGTITLTAKRSDGTCTVTKSVNVTRKLPTLPVLSGIPSQGLLCDGSIPLTATAQNADSYTWEATGVMRVNGATSVTVPGASSSVTVSAVGSGTGLIRVRANSSACNLSSAFTGQYNLKYNVPPTYFTNAQGAKVIAVGVNETQVAEYSGYPVPASTSSLKLKVYNTDATSMTWTLVNSTGTNASLLYPSNTTFENYVMLNGSTTGSFTVQTTIRNCFNLSQFGQFIFYIVSGSAFRAVAYPNPTTDELTVQFDESTTEQNMPEEINLYNGQQKLVKSVKVNQSLKEKAVKLDVKSLPKGTYYLQVVSPKDPNKAKRIESLQIKID